MKYVEVKKVIRNDRDKRFVAIIEASDGMAKAAKVKLIGYEKILGICYNSLCWRGWSC